MRQKYFFKKTKVLRNYTDKIYMNEFVKKWLDTHYAKYQMKNPPLEKSVYDHIMDWFKSPECAQEYLHKLDRIPVPVAIQLSNKWTETINKRNAKKIAQSKELEGVEVLYKFSNGYSMVKLVNKQSYQIEGVKMGHCVGSNGYYDEKDLDILSLRDQHNEPHCTIEFNRKNSSIDQIKGKANQEVVKKYHTYVAEFLNQFKFDSIYTHDIKNISSIYFGTYIFLNDSIPMNLVIDKNLKIEQTNFIHTFDTLEVKGDMVVSKNRRCRKIANTLIIHGDLLIEEFHGLLKIADKLIVKGNIEVSNCESLKLMASDIEAQSVCIIDCYNFNQKHELFEIIHEYREAV
jgi:hypothetical protein